MKSLVVAVMAVFMFLGAQAQIALPDGKPGGATGGRSQNRTERDESNFFHHSHFFTGGNFGLQFGAQSYVEISPSIGYKVTEKLRPGLGLNYQYYSQKDFTGARNSQSIVGWRAFASYEIFESIVAYTEYENLNINFDNQQIFISNAWFGGGLRQWIGEESAMDIYLVRNANFGPIQQAFYGSRWNIKMSFIIGL